MSRVDTAGFVIRGFLLEGFWGRSVDAHRTIYDSIYLALDKNVAHVMSDVHVLTGKGNDFDDDKMRYDDAR